MLTIKEIARAVFPPRIPEGARFVTVFETYLDVSRDEGDSNVYMLAGYTADARR